MKLIDLTLPTQSENLALDEWLLQQIELANLAGPQAVSLGTANAEPKPTAGFEILRLWEPRQDVVVIGRSSKIAEEVDVEFCTREKIPILRRVSGGASIVSGPGCLMYAVVLDLKQRPELRALDKAHCYVLTRIRNAVNACGIKATIQGTSDLTVGDRKFSGNSLRLTKNALLYHGTLLNNFDLNVISRCLKTPPRQPDYRLSRSHADFLVNLNLEPALLKENLVNAWQATGAFDPTKSSDEVIKFLRNEIASLAKAKYSQPSWNHQC
ncbi:MAG TPA: lipoate--protein ligase family protein [Pirellulaceae bacterium]|nr:lipoate--protein ligase family protein [Pirellulaceae bacterium]HMP69310.1 lipoate--protein ligase family protein [Pirellulaceae bacterium]